MDNIKLNQNVQNIWGRKWRNDKSKTMFDFHWITWQLSKTKIIRRHLLIYSVSLLKTSSPVRTNSFHISDNPFKSNKLQRSTDDHLLSVPKSGQRQNPDCNVIFRVEKAQLFFTLQSVSHFGIGFVQFHLRRKIRSKFSICSFDFYVVVNKDGATTRNFVPFWVKK